MGLIVARGGEEKETSIEADATIILEDLAGWRSGGRMGTWTGVNQNGIVTKAPGSKDLQRGQTDLIEITNTNSRRCENWSGLVGVASHSMVAARAATWKVGAGQQILHEMLGQVVTTLIGARWHQGILLAGLKIL